MYNSLQFGKKKPRLAHMELGPSYKPIMPQGEEAGNSFPWGVSMCGYKRLIGSGAQFLSMFLFLFEGGLTCVCSDAWRLWDAASISYISSYGYSFIIRGARRPCRASRLVLTLAEWS